jgi:hypothetical protein
MRLHTASLALLALLVSVFMSLPHGAEAAPKRPTPVPVSMRQHQAGPPGANGQHPTAVPEPSATLLQGLGLSGIVALERRPRKPVVQP